jgi:predicted transcriptional regulator
MAHQSTMRTVLEACLDACAEKNGEATTDEVSIKARAGDRISHKRVLNILSDLLRQGRLSRVRQGVYGPPVETESTLQRAEVMWRLLRMRRRVQVDDLAEMAGVSAKYAAEWLRMLVNRGVVIKHQQPGCKATWQLVSDQLEPPENTEKAAALREMRKQRKAAAMKMLEDVKRDLELACEALKNLDD